MKKLKKLLAWLLMVGMVLTLASCGKKEESGGKPADAPKSRLFKGEAEEANETTSYWCTVTGDRYELESVRLTQDDELRSYTRNEDGFYVLDDFWQIDYMLVEQYDLETNTFSWVKTEATPITVKLEKNHTGYYVVTGGATLDDYTKGMSYAIELRDDGTYVAHDYRSMALEYRRESKREILHGESPTGSVFEAWIEGETITSYNCVSGTYSVKDRGTAELLSFAAAPNAVRYANMLDSMEAMLADDTLTLEANGETLSMSRMDDKRYFCMADGEELIIELREDGTFTVLVGAGEVPYTEDLVVCEPGKSLRAMSDIGIAFEIEGDRLTISGDGMGETIILTEVK